MKKPFIYSLDLICSVLWSDAFDRKEQNGKTQLSRKDRLFNNASPSICLPVQTCKKLILDFYGAKNDVGPD